MVKWRWIGKLLPTIFKANNWEKTGFDFRTTLLTAAHTALQWQNPLCDTMRFQIFNIVLKNTSLLDWYLFFHSQWWHVALIICVCSLYHVSHNSLTQNKQWKETPSTQDSISAYTLITKATLAINEQTNGETEVSTPTRVSLSSCTRLWHRHCPPWISCIP